MVLRPSLADIFQRSGKRAIGARLEAVQDMVRLGRLAGDPQDAREDDEGGERQLEQAREPPGLSFEVRREVERACGVVNARVEDGKQRKRACRAGEAKGMRL